MPAGAPATAMPKAAPARASSNSSPGEKRRSVRESFARKVHELELLVASPAATDWYPETLTEFAAWHDPERDFSRWTKPNIVTSPDYADLRRRRDAAVEALGRSRAKPAATDGAARERALEKQVRVLASQIVRERAATRTAERQLREARADHATLETRYKELLSERRKVVSIVRPGAKG